MLDETEVYSPLTRKRTSMPWHFRVTVDPHMEIAGDDAGVLPLDGIAQQTVLSTCLGVYSWI